MPQKRNFPGSGPNSGSSPYSKRVRVSYTENDQDDEEPQNSVTPYEKPRNHPVFGQKSAFPGLHDADGDELFYGPAEDGLEYLRMVRSEANSLPTLFNAPAATEPLTESTEVTDRTEQTQIQQEAEPNKDTSPSKRAPEGIYSDGVYIGLATTKPVTDEVISSAQASYYNLLYHRFLLLRSILKCTPPSEAISALDDAHPISFPRTSKNAQKEWRRLVLAVDPQTVQLACMDMDSVLGVLVIVARLISENVRNGDAVLVRRIGSWAWGLLGKCREAGQLGASEFGEIRELGKRAVRILKKIREEEMEVQGEEEEEEEGYESGAEDNPREDGLQGEKVDEPLDATVVSDADQPGAEKATDAEQLEQAKARLGARISAALTESTHQEEEVIEARDSEAPDVDVGTQTRAMLDMIITIIGEHYGQRDLLEAREVWTEGEERFISPELPILFKLNMAPPLEISIPTTTTSTTSPPFTIYNITLRLPLRSFALSKRYSDFTTFHTTLTSQTTSPPPTPLPSKSWFSNTVSNASLRESRRQGLESYLRSINEASDPQWRNSPAWRAFLNLPSLGTNNSENISASSARLHAAATGPSALSGAGGEPISDPTLWLDCYRDMKSQLHDARLHLTRRDQETTPQRQHESSARAKSSLVRAGSLITALEDGLKRIGESNTNIDGVSKGRAMQTSSALGDGEIRRRKDLLINARKEKDGLEHLLNAMAAKSRVDNAVASIKDKEALTGGAGGSGAGGGRRPTRSGRVLGKETEQTRELDNQGVVQLQRDMMQEQDLSVEELMKVVRRQKELGIQINEELEVQNEMLRMVDEDATRLQSKIDVGKKRLGKIS
ncbi:uncharacterized protein BDV17DRAFT_285261 [Aspergillus undulatus]|uniref:uncharacterized protein n=1 Tax=Aspergillus undulatus TaxID=1810928 RepID=UPI003CCDA8A8